MILFDFECSKCGTFEKMVDSSDVTHANCPKCKILSKKTISKVSFKLKYNPQTDLCDWDGNTSQYWREYKKMKAEGKNPRIPALDGDG